jgi:signal peptidase I
MAQTTDFFDRLQGLTERYLTRRRRIRRIKKEKQQRKHPLVDWLEAFLWAAGMVLLINQYLVQAYQIPSGSMIDTLLIGDRVFVNKILYGPELLPGLGKLPGPVKPRRNDSIIFENPSYISRGPVFDIAQRIIYMLTLSFVDIDRDESGEPKAHFLIKRAVGVAGDRIVMDQGEFRIRFAGEDRWIPEGEYAASRNWGYRISRLLDQSAYPALEAAGKLTAYLNLGLSPPKDLTASAVQIRDVRFADYLFQEQARLELLRAAYPEDGRYGAALARYTLGWYIPEGRIFPLGDNRDNSRDGRYFNPVRVSKVLGKGTAIYWPLSRLGFIR